MLLPCIILFYGLFIQVQGNTVYTEKHYNELDKNITEDYHVEYVLIDSNNPCKRNCEVGAPAMICRYHFEIEWYHALSKACFDCPLNITDCFRPHCVPADGSKRGIVTINRQMPGPAIEVCQNDIIVVDLLNKMTSEATTLHWHGQHQKATPYMDGVPSVTQCPILPHDTFRYTFKAAQAGTHFYHSHIGMQRADGAFGALIVRVPEVVDPHSQLYDFDLSEHILTIIDWATELGTEIFLSHHHNDGDNKPPTLLINGLGRFKEFDNGTSESVFMPTARFKVEQGYRYRFRVINAGFLNCPIEMTVDNHTITVISSDGADFNAVEVTSLVTYAGERFDFILNADQPKDLYWIRFKGLMDCDERFTKAFQVAVLQYNVQNDTVDDEILMNSFPPGNITYDNAHVDGVQLNPLNIGTEGNTSVIVLPNLEGLRPWDMSLKQIADYQFYVAYDFYEIDNTEFHTPPHYGFYKVKNPKNRVLTPQLNHISMEMPSFPLLSQRDEIPDDMFCNNETLKEKNCTSDHCTCPHGIQVPLGSVVEIILIDEGFAYDANHPLHLHGYAFRVVAMERMGRNVTVAQVKERDSKGLIKRNLKNAPFKDTVTVPDGGYTIVRFVADNPGYWILHCHLEFHSEIGMALIIQVGEKEEMPPVPNNFPRCGNYQPDPIESGTDLSTNKKSAALSNFVVNKFLALISLWIFPVVNSVIHGLPKYASIYSVLNFLI